MVRAVATLLLVGLLFFLAISPWEQCESRGDSCAPACHFFCPDGCTLTLLAETAPELAPLPSVEGLIGAADTAPGHPSFPPELPPPRV